MNRSVRIKRRLTLFARRERGTQMIEFAIALPFMLLMFAGTAELGRLFYQYTTIAKATRVGARYLSASKNASSANTTTKNQAITEAKNLMVCGSTSACGSTTVATGFDAADITVTPPASGLANVKYVTVTISGFTYQPVVFDLAGMTGNSNLSLSIPLSPSTTMRYMP